MTYQYIRLAVGRLKRYRGIYEAIPLDEDGNELPPMSEDEMMFRCATRKVIDYTVEGNVMYCRLEGLKK